MDQGSLKRVNRGLPAAALLITIALASTAGGVVAAPPSPCVASDAAALSRCTQRVSTGAVLSVQLAGVVACPPNFGAPCLDLTAPRPAPLMVTAAGHGASAQAGLYRSSYAQPLLAVSGGAVLVLRRLTFEDAPWPSCYPKSQPPGHSSAMVSINGASRLLVENCTFLHGHKIAVGLSGNYGVAFSSNVWLESQTFGVWTGGDSNDAVHLFNNQFLRGKNNAIIGILSGSVLQGNTFVYNHHVACFNQSGGQMCLTSGGKPNRAVMTFAANRVVDGVITGGEGPDGENPGPPGGLTSQAFELNAGVQLRLLHNDMWNNSGWSIIPNRARWPNNASVSLQANRMCSHRSAQPNGSTIGGNATEQSEWLHIVGTRNCEAANFMTPGEICADVNCQPPIRPRGGIQHHEPRIRNGGEDEVVVHWWASDVTVGSVHVLRDFNVSTGVQSPQALPDSVRGNHFNGSMALTPKRSFAEGGEIIALHAAGYGVLDVTFIAGNGASS